jgi:FkbM family methyltransferase
MLAQSLQHSQALDARFEQLQLAVDTYARQLQHSIDTRSDEAKAGREIASAATAQLQTQQATTAGMLAHLQADMLHLLQRAAVPLNEEDMLVRTSWGWLATPREDERLLMAMIETAGRLEPGSTAVLTALLDPGQTMIDVGAHIGTMTLPAAHAVGPHGRVVAVEPGPRAAGLLARSLHINSLAERVTLHQLAAGSAEGDAMLHVAAVLGENSLIGSAAGSADSIVVPVRRLDDLLGGIPVDVVKIDAEGYELQVWAGMPSILAENPTLAVIVEFGPVHLARAGITIAAWLDALRGLGFTIWEIDEQSAGVRELRPLAELAEVFSMNLLLLRQSTSHYPRLRVL